MAKVHEGDTVIFSIFVLTGHANLLARLAIPDFNEFPTPNRPGLDFVCFSVYDTTFPLAVAFGPTSHKNVLAEVFGGPCVRNFDSPKPEICPRYLFF